MVGIKNEIISVAQTLGIMISELTADAKEVILMNIYKKYTNGKKGQWLWEYMIDPVSVSNKDAWMWGGDFIGKSKTIMFFNLSDERIAFAFNSGEDVVKILSETFGFEFYWTDENTSYLISFDHHDVLSAVGSAKSWLEKYKIPKNDNCFKSV